MAVAVLGCTGSVGAQTLDVVAAHPEAFRVVALAARHDTPLLREQVLRHRPLLVSLQQPPGADFPRVGELVCGDDGLTAAATAAEANIIVVATSGHAAILPTIAAIEAGKTIALANKETLVCAGEIIMPLVQRQGVPLRPVDSEHSAIWQALQGARRADVARLIITASGGPFRQLEPAELATVTARDALAHPTWSMGAKITIDSASLMNKGLEVIEAHWLFDLPYAQIDVVVHPESIIHSVVEYVDGSQLAQLGLPDMRTPIQYALSYPGRLPRAGNRLDLARIGALHFDVPDVERFPCLRLAREAGLAGNTYPTVLSAADDVAVAAFLDGAISFPDIPVIIDAVTQAHVPDGPVTVERILAADAWARGQATALIHERGAS
ncbi:MAG: 1-deoxy-D-xylulose-5-phosphate reductoisomerase [Thermomicrobiales bacterium]|nr:1-deoxy-D-xylulose-5-phosphate reductoisomerase [Thermomicrobiales bacterium]